MCSLYFFFFFKQKTAYEMRISDWSSDVCSSDLLPEYKATRARAGSFMSLAQNPDYAAEVTLQPLARYELDAAILFSDILTVPHEIGRASCRERVCQYV